MKKKCKKIMKLLSMTVFSLITMMVMMSDNAAKAADVHSYPTVAVMEFGNKAITSSGMREYEFQSASEYAIYQLLASNWFDLVDYEQLENIAKMHNINMSGLIDQSTAVQLGKIAGAQFMVVGNVTGLTVKESGLNYNHADRAKLGVNTHLVTANVAIRIVDIETGKIVGAGLGKGESNSSHVEVSYTRYRKKRTTDTTNIVESTTAETSSSTTKTTSTTNNTEYNNEEESEESEESTETDNSTENDSSSNTSDNTNTSNTRTITDALVSEEYKITIGTTEVSAIQVRNAISKAVRDGIYGNMGLMTMLNDGKKLKVKTGF